MHIKHISNKISKSTSVLKMLKYTFPTNALKTIYHSLYNYNCSKLIYLCYNNNTHNNFKNKLIKIVIPIYMMQEAKIPYVNNL